MKNRLTVSAILIIIIFIANACKQSSEPVESYKDPREMTWSVDTLQYNGTYQTNMSKIIAFTTTDIFIYGRSSEQNGQVYHYDGSKWKAVSLSTQFGGCYIKKIISFSNTKFYGVGEDQFYMGKIFSGDGLTWSLINAPRTEGLLSICSIGNRYLYAGGRNGDILYFDGLQWNYDYKRIIPEAGRNYVIRAAEAYKDTVHFLGSMWGTTKNVFYHIKGKYKDWKVVDSMVQANSTPVIKWGDQDLYVSPTNRLFSYGYHGIWEYAGKDWKTILMCDYAINGMFSLTDNYLIGCGDLGRVFYYDGTSWKLLTQFQRGYENVLYQTAWGNGKELFIVGYTEDYPMRTIIWHGK